MGARAAEIDISYSLSCPKYMKVEALIVGECCGDCRSDACSRPLVLSTQRVVNSIAGHGPTDVAWGCKPGEAMLPIDVTLVIPNTLI